MRFMRILLQKMCIRDRRYEDSVGTKFQPGTNIRITYVFYPNVQTNEQRTLIGFYVKDVYKRQPLAMARG